MQDHDNGRGFPTPLPARPNRESARRSTTAWRPRTPAEPPRLPRAATKPQARGTLHTGQDGSEPASALSRSGFSPRMPPGSWHRDAQGPARIADFRLPIDHCADCRLVFSSAARARFLVVRAFSVPCSLFPIPSSLLWNVPLTFSLQRLFTNSLFPVPYSLFPIPCSLFPPPTAGERPRKIRLPRLPWLVPPLWNSCRV